MNYVYEQDYAVLVRLKVPADARGTIPIRASARWLACTDKICVPEKGELSLDLPVGEGTPNRAQFDAWRQALPQPLGSVGRFEVAGNKLRVAIPLPASVEVAKPYLFPMIDGPVDYEAKQDFSRSGDTLIAELQRKGPAPTQLPAVVALGNGRGLDFTAVPGPVPHGTPIGGLGWSAVLWAVLGAIAGGILLNLMPCVFPILALKALHLSRAGGEAREARSDALAYTAGAIIGTGVLGAILLAIRAAGAEAGWAFQLQDPRTIMLLLLLAVAITANLLGLFELPVVGGAADPRGASAPARSPPSSRRPARGHSSARRLEPRCCCLLRGRSSCSRRWASGSRCRSCWWRSFRRFAPGCRGRAPGCDVSSASSRSRWQRRPSLHCGCSTASAARRR